MSVAALSGIIASNLIRSYTPPVVGDAPLLLDAESEAHRLDKVDLYFDVPVNVIDESGFSVTGKTVTGISGSGTNVLTLTLSSALAKDRTTLIEVDYISASGNVTAVTGGADLENVVDLEVEKYVAVVESLTYEAATWKYWLYYPKGYFRSTNSGVEWPMAFELHGNGEGGTNENALLKVDGGKCRTTMSHITNDTYGVALETLGCANYIHVAPQDRTMTPANGQTWTLEWLDDIRTDLHVTKALRIDLTRIYCAGLSMGGKGAWDWAVRNLNYFAAIIPMSGNPYAMIDYEGTGVGLRNLLENVQAHCTHGGSDGTAGGFGVGSSETVYGDAEALSPAPRYPLKYARAAGIGHGGWADVWGNLSDSWTLEASGEDSLEMWPWLNSIQKNNAVRAVWNVVDGAGDMPTDYVLKCRFYDTWGNRVSVRTSAGATLNNTNVDALVTFKEDDSAGSTIPHDVTVSTESGETVIIVTPTSDFSPGDVVYASISNYMIPFQDVVQTGETSITATANDIYFPVTINFNRLSADNVPGINNCENNGKVLGVMLSNMVDDDGNTTGMSISMDAIASGDGTSAPNTDAVWNAAMISNASHPEFGNITDVIDNNMTNSYWYINNGIIEMSILGVYEGVEYEAEFFGSSSASGTRTTDYSFDGQTKSFNPANSNITLTALWEGSDAKTAGATGRFALEVENNAHANGYVNGFRIWRKY